MLHGHGKISPIGEKKGKEQWQEDESGVLPPKGFLP
jgi:hypothetical protein